MSSTTLSFKADGSALNWALGRATLQAIVIVHNFELLATQFIRRQLKENIIQGRLLGVHGVHSHSWICMGWGLWPQISRSILTLAELFVLD